METRYENHLASLETMGEQVEKRGISFPVGMTLQNLHALLNLADTDQIDPQATHENLSRVLEQLKAEEVDTRTAQVRIQELIATACNQLRARVEEGERA